MPDAPPPDPRLRTPDPRTSTPGFAFAQAWHDRLGRVRGDDDWAPGLWKQNEPCVVVTDGRHVVLDGEDLELLPPSQAPPGDRAVLGDADGGPTYLAVLVDELPEQPGRVTTRDAATTVTPLGASLLAHAAGLANWHRTHPRCARCGAETVAAEAGHIRRCPVCGASHFPRTDPAVIMLITDADDRALLGRQRAWPEGRFSTLAGFVEPGETLEDAVRREVAEEVGITISTVSYGASQAWPFPSSLMVGFFAVAGDTEIDVDGVEIAEARWVTRDELTALAAGGSVRLPGRLSISRWLIETWYGGEVPGTW